MRRSTLRRGRRWLLRSGLALAGLGLLAGCGLLPPGAPPRKIHRIGVLGIGTGPSPQTDAFIRALRDLGYVEGQDLAVEWRFSESRPELAGLADDLVALPVEVILAAGAGAAYSARGATREIPVVFAEEPDPVGEPGIRGPRLIESLARPGTNVTGLTTFGAELSAKRLELLKEAVPGLHRVGLLVSGETTSQRNRAIGEAQIAAPMLGLTAQALVVRRPEELGSAFEQATRSGVGGVVVVGDPLLRAQAGRIAELAVQHRLPAVHDAREFAEVGGLLAYGPDLLDLYRRAAGYVDRILKGASPSDLPVEQPTKFELVINLATAHTIGLMIPQALLQQATETIL